LEVKKLKDKDLEYWDKEARKTGNKDEDFVNAFVSSNLSSLRIFP
jgi:hypothetical protein